MRAQPAIELVEHDAGLDRAALAGHVERQHMVEILRAVDDQRGVHGLAGLRGAGAARQHAHALLARERERMLGLFHRARGDHADRHDLVVRGVGGIAPARERIEVHLAQEMRLRAAVRARARPFPPLSILACFAKMGAGRRAIHNNRHARAYAAHPWLCHKDMDVANPGARPVFLI